ncbi:MAG TPA: hypothetical protein VLN26_09465, partial [Gaiellaceae bacterium]|nr:hypothetical protein [Gaiellaceae bacterium]
MCGTRRGEVLVLGLGRSAAGRMEVGSTRLFVQRGDTFVGGKLRERRLPYRTGEFRNCRPWIG